MTDRFRITARGTDIELRGHVSGEVNVRLLAQALDGLALVIASPAEGLRVIIGDESPDPAPSIVPPYITDRIELVRDIARSIALTDGLIDPPMNGKYGRYAVAALDAVIAAGYRPPVPAEPANPADVNAADLGLPTGLP